MKVEYIKNVHGLPGFRVTIDDPGQYRETSFTATVDQVTSWEVSGDEPSDHEPYLSCMIKWDSCSHFHFGEPRTDPREGRDGYLHLCGVDDFKNHAIILEALYRMAFREMGREPEPGEVWEGAS